MWSRKKGFLIHPLKRHTGTTFLLLVSFMHRRIKRQKGRQRSPLIFWLFDAARGGGRGYCDSKFYEETHGNMMGLEPGTIR